MKSAVANHKNSNSACCLLKRRIKLVIETTVCYLGLIYRAFRLLFLSPRATSPLFCSACFRRGLLSKEFCVSKWLGLSIKTARNTKIAK